MAEFPYLPFWTDAYIADCSHLSDAEHGRYLLILVALWRSPGCRIPNDDEWLARRFRRPVEAVKSELRPLLAEFCQTDGNWLWQKRLSAEHKRVITASRKRSDAAKSMHRNKKHSSQAHAWPAQGGHMHPEPYPEPEPLRENPSDSPPYIPPPQNGAHANGSQPRKPIKIDLATWEPCDMARKYAIDRNLDPAGIVADIRDWAANAPAGKRLKIDPLAFWRGWCRRDAERRAEADRRSGAARPRAGGILDAAAAVLARRRDQIPH